MSGEGIWWPIAKFAADQIVEELAPHCERIEISGSVRRRKEAVGDVEIVCIPKPGTVATEQGGMFDDLDRQRSKNVPDAVTQYLEAGIAEGCWTKRLNSRGNVSAFGPKNKFLDRVWNWDSALTVAPETVPVDVFSATPETWGALMAIRTGPKELNEYAAVRAHTLGMMLSVREGGFVKDGEILSCSTEEQFFELLKLPVKDPTERSADWVLELRREKS